MGASPAPVEVADAKAADSSIAVDAVMPVAQAEDPSNVVSNVNVSADVGTPHVEEKKLEDKPLSLGKKHDKNSDGKKPKTLGGLTTTPTDTGSGAGTPTEQGAAVPSPGAATTTSLSNGISAADVNAAIAQKLHPLRACASSDSTVSVHLSVAPGGKVADASATRSTPDDARLRDCVELALRTLYFGSSPSDRGTALSFDLDLKPLTPP